jgi:prepilin-type N-terminal cleavage/methylation domain-containing protein
MNARPKAFTLIELLLVIAIVAVLMALLLPAVGAVQRTVQVNETRSRIAILGEAINQYSMVYDGIVPPTGGSGWNYPIVERTQFNPNRAPYSHTRGNLGAHYLTYFLLGPENFGWDVNIHKVKRGWVPPDVIRTYVSEQWRVGNAVTDSLPHSHPHWAFEDAWGPNGTRSNNTGSLQYMAIRPRGSPPYNRHDLGSAYYWGGTRGFEAGDGQNGHIDRLAKNVGTQRYIIVSSGPDRRFGFYRWDKNLNPPRRRADAELGTSDDIANIPID